MKVRHSREESGFKFSEVILTGERKWHVVNNSGDILLKRKFQCEGWTAIILGL